MDSIQRRETTGEANTNFVERRWLVDKVLAAASSEDTRIVLLVGNTGVGKSTLLRHLAKSHKDSFVFALRRDSISSLDPPDAKSFLLRFGFHLAATHPSLFADEALQAHIEQRINTIGPKGEVVGVRVHRYVSSPFTPAKLSVLQDVDSVDGRLVGIQIDEWIREHRHLSVEDLYDIAMVAPLQWLRDANGNESVNVFIDALDEIELRSHGPETLTSVFDFLRDFHALPGNLRILVTSRRGAFLDALTTLEHVKVVPIAENAAENLRDIAAFISESVKRIDAGAILHPTLSQTLAHRAQGNFLYASLDIRALQSAISAGQTNVVETLFEGKHPEGLPRLLRAIVSRLQGAVEARYERANWGDVLGPLLAIIALAPRALSYDEIALVSGQTRTRVVGILGMLGPILDFGSSGDEPVTVYHKAVADYLLDCDTPHRVRATDAIDHAYRSVLDSWGGLSTELRTLRRHDPANKYALDYLVRHLLENGRASEAMELLLSPRFLARRFEVSTARQTITEMTAVLVTAAAQEKVLTALQMFLRNHSGWLADNQNGFLPQLLEWHFRSTSAQSPAVADYIEKRVAPVCAIEFPEGCLWLNEAPQPRAIGTPFGAGILNTFNQRLGVELADGAVAVAGMQSVSVLDADGLIWQSDEVPYRFVSGLFPYGSRLGLIASEHELHSGMRYLVGMFIDPWTGSQREMFRFGPGYIEEQLLAATAVSNDEIHVFLRHAVGVRRIIFRTGLEPIESIQLFPGFVGSVSCRSSHEIYVAAEILREGQSRSEKAFAAATARRLIYRWTPERDQTELVFQSQQSTIRFAVSLLLQMVPRANGQSSVNSMYPLGALVCDNDGVVFFARGGRVFRLEPGRKKATTIYEHPHNIRDLVLTQEGLIVLGGEAVKLELKALTARRVKSSPTVITCAATLPNGLAMLFTRDRPFALLNPANGRQRRVHLGTLRGPVIKNAAVSRSGTIAVLGFFDGVGAILKPTMFGLGFLGIRPSSWALVPAPDGSFLSITWHKQEGTIDGCQLIRIHDDGRSEIVASFPRKAWETDDHPLDLVFNDRGALVIVTKRGRGLTWDLTKGEIVSQVRYERYDAWSLKGKSVGALSGGRLVGSDEKSTIYVWDEAGRICAQLFVGFSSNGLVSSPITDQITVVGEGCEVNLSLRTDPHSLSARKRAKQRQPTDSWKFARFSRWVFREKCRKWPGSVAGSFLFCCLLLYVFGNEGFGLGRIWGTVKHALGSVAIIVFFYLIMDLWRHWRLNRAVVRLARGK